MPHAGANASTLVYAPVNNGQGECTITLPSGNCYTAPSASSTIVNVTTQPIRTPTITLSGPASEVLGMPPTIIATLSNGPAGYTIGLFYLLASVPTICGNQGSCDERAIIREKKANRFGNFFGSANTSQGLSLIQRSIYCCCFLP